MDRYLRGDKFVNRYRISGVLTTVSPLHIGSGEETPDPDAKPDAEGQVHTITRIIKDGYGKPLIPGSALKGVMRHWLLGVLKGLKGNLADTRVYSDKKLTNLDQDKQIELVRGQWSWLELLFGTPFHGGKLEVWDSQCITGNVSSADRLLKWDPKGLVYRDVSVAIDPKTGTAAENLLYETELVPPGVQFRVDVCGQNLSDLEVGMVLLALQGFNSQIYPVTLGARGGRGYGRMRFTPEKAYRITAAELPTWLEATLKSFDDKAREAEAGVFTGEDQAGYYALPAISAEALGALVVQAKAAFLAAKEGRDG